MGCPGIHPRGRLGRAWSSSGVQPSLEACPVRPAGTEPFPGPQPGGSRPQSYSSPRLRPGLGLTATPDPLMVLPSPGSRWSLGRTPLDLSAPRTGRLPPALFLAAGVHVTNSQPPPCGPRLPEPGPPTVGLGEAALSAWSHPHQTACAPSLGEGADPAVTRDLKGGIPSKREGEGPSPYCLQTLPRVLEVPRAASLPLPWASHRHTSGTSRF